MFSNWSYSRDQRMQFSWSCFPSIDQNRRWRLHPLKCITEGAMVCPSLRHNFVKSSDWFLIGDHGVVRWSREGKVQSRRVGSGVLIPNLSVNFTMRRVNFTQTSPDSNSAGVHFTPSSARVHLQLWYIFSCGTSSAVVHHQRIQSWRCHCTATRQIRMHSLWHPLFYNTPVTTHQIWTKSHTVQDV